MSEESVGKAAVRALGLSGEGKTDPFRDPWKHGALKTRLDFAFRDGAAYITGRPEVDNGNSD